MIEQWLQSMRCFGPFSGINLIQDQTQGNSEVECCQKYELVGSRVGPLSSNT